MRDRLFLQNGIGFIVEDIASLVDHTVLAVAGVGVQRDIGDHAQVWKVVFQRPHDRWHKAIWVERFFAPGGFQRCLDHGKQRNCRNPQGSGFLAYRQELVEGQSFDTGHRRYCFAALFTRQNEHGIDEISRCQNRFAHQVAQKAGATQAAHTALGELSEIHDLHINKKDSRIMRQAQRG